MTEKIVPWGGYGARVWALINVGKSTGESTLKNEKKNVFRIKTTNLF